MEADADGASGHDELLRTTVRSERRAQALDVHARDEEVGVPRFVPEQVVAHRAADDVRVQPERADILLNLLRRERSPRSRRAHPTEASRPRPWSARGESNRPARRRSRSCRRSRRGSAGTPSSSPDGRARSPPPRGSHAGSTKTCCVCALMSPGTRSFSPGRNESWPETNTKPFALIACEYGAPWNGAGAASVRTTSFVTNPPWSPVRGDRPGRAPHRPP